jgi:glycosyltransferase involved in cell wall biosynthesis
MNIIFFSKYYFPHIGGVEKHAREVAERLVYKGHHVTIITLRYDQKLSVNQKKGGVKILRLPFSNHKFTIWKNLWQQKELIKQADLIHCHDVFFWYWPIKLFYPLKKVFITFHGWEGKFPIPYKFRLIRKINENTSNGNICIGDYLTKHYGTKTKYISYGGVSTEETHPSFKDPTEIVFIGRLDKDLGLDEHLKALTKIKANLKLKITFVGDGPYRKKAQKIGKVTGMVKNIKPYLNKDCLVFASSYLTILEAMAHKRPVFALYQNELKKDYLTLFPGSKYLNLSGSAKELIDQVTNYLQGPTLKVNQAYSYAKQQTWDNVVKLYLKLWNQN